MITSSPDDPKKQLNESYICESNYPSSDDLSTRQESDTALKLEKLSLYQRKLLKEVQEAISEFNEIRSSRAWKVVKTIRGLRFYMFIRNLLLIFLSAFSKEVKISRDVIIVHTLGKKNPASKSSEVWLLAINTLEGTIKTFDNIRMEGGFYIKEEPISTLREVIFSANAGQLIIPNASEIKSIVLLAHPWSGIVEIEIPNGKIQVDLYREEARDINIDIQSGTVTYLINDIKSRVDVGSITTGIIKNYRGSSLRDEMWIKNISRDEAEVIAIVHPDWLGIRNSSMQLFSHHMWIGDELDAKAALNYANMIAETGCKRVVFSGFPITHRHLAIALNKRVPEVMMFVVWHGNFLQTREDYNWRAYQEVIRLAKRGIIYKVGFVKKGMDEAHSRLLGIRSSFVMNFLDNIPNNASLPKPGGPHIGVWSPWADNWRKPLYSMLVAASMIPNAVIHGSHASDRVEEFLKTLNIKANFKGQLLSPDQMLKALGDMHVNLYVTLTECAPMLPLESLAVGVPCLIGPNSHLFEDDVELKEILVVPYPDRSEIIAEYIIRAISKRVVIIKRYQQYAIGYNKRARQSIRDLLEIG